MSVENKKANVLKVFFILSTLLIKGLIKGLKTDW